MNKTMRALLLASLVASPLLLAGCGNKEEAVANEATEAVAAAMASPRYEGEGVYVGQEPPEGFTIKAEAVAWALDHIKSMAS